MRCVCAHVCEKEGARERQRGTQRSVVCVCGRGRHGHTTAACLLTHTSVITVSVMRLWSPLRHELMVKLGTLLTDFTFILKAKAHVSRYRNSYNPGSAGADSKHSGGADNPVVQVQLTRQRRVSSSGREFSPVRTLQEQQPGENWLRNRKTDTESKTPQEQ